jgi:SAM-dependent methyltransferase
VDPQPPRVPLSLGAKAYATVWDTLADVREHAFELVDESKNEDELSASGERLAPFLIRGLGLTKSDVVLEIGCGVARLGKPIAPHVREWWGIDVSAKMVEHARERTRALGNVRFFVGNGHDLAGVPPASVDAMYCHAVFIHLDKEDLYSYLLDAKRVLKPGGLFYFDIWNLCDEVGWLRWQVERALYRDKSQRPLHRNQFASPDEIRMMLKMAGWEILQLAETFSVQPVVTHVPPNADREAFLGDLKRRAAGCYSILRYSAEDYRTFSEALARQLREGGFVPEVDETKFA